MASCAKISKRDNASCSGTCMTLPACRQISVTEALSVCLWVPPPHRHQNKQAGFIQAIAIQQKMLTKPFSSNSSNPLMWTEFCIQMLHAMPGSVWTGLN